MHKQTIKEKQTQGTFIAHASVEVHSEKKEKKIWIFIS